MADLEPGARSIAKLMEAIGPEVTLVDSEARVITSTAGSRAALGYDKAFWQAANLLEIAHPDDVARAQGALQEILASPGGTGRERLRARHADGHWEIIEVQGKNLLADPDVGALVLTTRTVTEEERLRAAHAEALSNASSQAEYIASVSHELRSPLQGILGVAQLLESQLTGEAADLIAIIGNETDRLRRVIDDILDYAKATEGRMEIDPKPAELRLILDAVANIVRPQLPPTVELSIEVDPTIRQWVLVDGPRLHQVLLNLATNAARFTTVGAVTLRCQGRNNTLVNFAISDTGTGIAPDKIDSMFEPFQQGDPSPHRRGTGLGLTISRELIELMDGRLDVETMFGVGSTFSFEIDAPATSAPPEVFAIPAATPVDGRRGKALVIDDADVNRLVIGRQLESMGFEVDHAPGGVEGVAMATDRQYVLIIVDWHMPEVDGLEATRRIRTYETTIDRHTPIISMTASAMPGDKEKCLAAGVDGFLAKPATRSELADTVSAMIESNRDEREFTDLAASGGVEGHLQVEQAVVDFEVLSTLASELGTGAVASVVESYLRNLDTRGHEIIEAIRAQEPDVARRMAHTLKSPSHMLGAIDLGNLCHSIEVNEIEASPGSAEDLQRCLEGARDGLQRWLDCVEEETP